MNRVWGTPVGFALVLALTPAALAQSLGDVARKEEARRKAVAGAGKVYTNDQLRGDVAPARPAPAAADTTSPAPDAGAPGDKKAGDNKDAEKPAAAPDAKKDQAYWRERMTSARTAIDRSKAFAEALQSQINGLSAEFTARDDPAQRNLVADKRQKALDELARVKKEIADLEKAISGIEDEARKAGVPPGWLR